MQYSQLQLKYMQMITRRWLHSERWKVASIVLTDSNRKVYKHHNQSQFGSVRHLVRPHSQHRWLWGWILSWSKNVYLPKDSHLDIADSGDTERRYIQKVEPKKEAAIHEALIWFGVIKVKWYIWELLRAYVQERSLCQGESSEKTR